MTFGRGVNSIVASGPLGKDTNNNFVFEEVQEVYKDKKGIKVTGFEEAYDNFKKTLPHILSGPRQFYDHHGLNRIEKLNCNCEAYVAKKIRWKNVGNRLRVVFCVKEGNIIIVEIYFKGKVDIENKDRVCKYCQ